LDPALKEQLHTARTLYREGKFIEAETAFLKARDVDPGNAAVQRGLGSIALWNNRPEKAERCFKEAARRASGLGRMWPFGVRHDASLAMTYYRMDRFPDAARHFKKAAGPLAVGPFRHIKALGDHLALFGDDAPYAVEGPDETRAPFAVTDPLPVVEVSVNNGTPLPFFIDTGAAEVILDRSLAKEVGAEISGSITGRSSGTKGAVGLGRVGSLRIGDVDVENVPVHTTDTGPFSAVFNGLNIKGVIGTRLLMHFLATIDYAEGSLVLRRATEEKRAELENEVATGAVSAVPFWLIQTHYMVAWGTVNDVGPMLFFVDTGLAGRGFTARESILARAGVAVDWTKTEEGIAGFGEAEGVDIKLDKLTLGTAPRPVVKHDVPGAACKKPSEILGYHLGFHVGGLISHQFFRDGSLTFDFNGMRLLLKGKS